jgi:hypothetical protein
LRGHGSNKRDGTPNARPANESVWTLWLRVHAHELDTNALASKLLRLGHYTTGDDPLNKEN